jgi:cell division protease FtsH
MADDPFKRAKDALRGIIDRLRGNPAKTPAIRDSPLTWPTDERHRVAIHEAGHAIVAWSMTTVAEVSSIVIFSGGNGMTTWTGDKRMYDSGHPLALWERCAVCFGGIAAEAHAYGNYYRYASADDLRKAWAVSERLANRSAMSPMFAISPWGTPPDDARSDIASMFPGPIPSLQERILLAAYCRARLVAAVQHRELRALAREAVRRRKLNAEDIALVLGPRPWAIR